MFYENQPILYHNTSTVTRGVRPDNNKYNYCMFFPLKLVQVGLIRKVFVLRLAAN